MAKKLKKVVMTILTATMLCGVSSLAFAGEGTGTDTPGGCDHTFKKACYRDEYGGVSCCFMCTKCGKIAP